MASQRELYARIQQYFRYSKQELSGMLAVILVLGFIFSFRDWGGDTFDPGTGVMNLLAVIIIAAIAVFFRTACQKIYGLGEGYKAEFKVWWTGLALSLVFVFVSLGKLPLIFAGGMVATFMVRQRLGEFRYGFSMWNNGMISHWGILANLILAILFAVGGLAVPESYFFSKGLLLNLIMAACQLIPLPQLDGLNVFFGARWVFFVDLALLLLGGILLLSGTKIGLVIAIVIGAVYGIVYALIGSEK